MYLFPSVIDTGVVVVVVCFKERDEDFEGARHKYELALEALLGVLQGVTPTPMHPHIPVLRIGGSLKNRSSVASI